MTAQVTGSATPAGSAGQGASMPADIGPFAGSIPTTRVSSEVLKLTIKDAIQMGLKNNLGLILSSQGTDFARAARIRALSELLPNLTGSIGVNVQQVSLAQFGFPPSLAGGKAIIGPFGYFDAHATLDQRVFDFKSWYKAKASQENQQAARWSYQNARDLVVLVTGASYLQAIAAGARVEAAQAELKTAETVYNRASDMKSSGMVPAIEVLRAQVEMQAEQQRLLAARNQLERAKLQLARVIGLPVAQAFELTDQAPYAPLPPVTLEAELNRAYEHRSDYKALQSQVRSAELLRRSAQGGNLPSLEVRAQYGDVGQNLANSHGVFAVSGGVTIPIFQGNKVKADVLQAETQLKQQQVQLENLRSQIEYELRVAFLDVQTAAEAVDVATSTLKVAHDQLQQSEDRFSAGVTSNLEVVQAQQAVAVANENYISSLYAHNFAKLSLARAVGVAEDAVMNYLGGK